MKLERGNLACNSRAAQKLSSSHCGRPHEITDFKQTRARDEVVAKLLAEAALTR